MKRVIESAVQHFHDHPGEAIAEAICLVVIVGGLLIMPFAASGPLIQ